MISPNDLREILLEDAEDAPAVPANELMTGIRRKVRARRRAKISGVGAAVAAVLAASLAVVPQFVDTSSPEPVEPTPDRPHLEFPERVEGLRIVASQVNEPGSSSLEWRLTLPTLKVVQTTFCRIPRRHATSLDAATGAVTLVVMVNGNIVATTRCRIPDDQSSYPPRDREIVPANRVNPGANGVVAGERFTVSMWLQRGPEQVEVPGAEFGFGFADAPAPGRPIAADPQLPQNARGS